MGSSVYILFWRTMLENCMCMVIAGSESEAKARAMRDHGMDAGGARVAKVMRISTNMTFGKEVKSGEDCGSWGTKLRGDW